MDAAPDDSTLVKRTRRGESDAFGVLVRRYQNAVFNVCYRMLGERRDAEDLTQETFVRAYNWLDTFDITRSFGPWIRKIATNLCLNHLQQRRNAAFPLDEEFDMPEIDGTTDPSLRQEESETASTVRAAILALPPHYRAVIELRHYQDMNYADIASALDLPLNTVRSHLFRARKLLAQHLHKVDVL